MESQESAQQQLDALERDRQQVRARLVLPWWHHVAWGVVWCVFTISTLLVHSSWIFAIYAGTSLSFIALWWARVRMLGLRLKRPRDPAWKIALQVAIGVVMFAGAVALALALHSVWPMVIGNIAIAVTIVLGSIREDRRQAVPLRDER